MRVLIINPILYTSETDIIPKVKSIKDTMIYTLCLGFLKNGDIPVLIAASDYKPLDEESYPFEIKWMDSKWKSFCKPRCLPMLSGLFSYLKINQDAFDAIIASEVFSLSTLTSVYVTGEKTMIWHELGAHNNFMKKIPSKIWYNTIPGIFMRDNLVIPRSKSASEFISKFCSHVSDIVIDHGVDIEKIRYSTEKENYFVVISQLIERKRIDGILEKFHLFIKAENTNYSLKIIGDGNQKAALIKKAKELHIDNKVEFYGKQTHEQIAPVLERAKALLVNTVKDNSMVSIVESIAAGTPVLTTDVPFNAYYIEKEKLGIVRRQWGEAELKEICKFNEEFVGNCVRYRDKLSNSYCAEQFKILMMSKGKV